MPALSVVPDTNIWVAVLIRSQGRYAQLLNQAIAAGVELYTSQAILDEVAGVLLRRRVAGRYGFTAQTVEKGLGLLQEFTTVVSDGPAIDAVPNDPDDNKIIACALAARAHYIISYDKHLLRLGKYQSITIVTPSRLSSLLKLMP